MGTLPTTANVASPRLAGYGVSLNSLLLRLAAGPDRPLVTETAPAQAPRFQTEANPQDVMPGYGDIHSQEDFTGGEGLFDRFRRNGAETDATRFWASEHVDVSPASSGGRKRVTLLPTCERVDTIAATVRVANDGVILWATDGQTLSKTSDVLATTPVFAADDPHGGETATDVEDVAVLGGVPYAALGVNGVHRDSSGWAHYSDVQAVRLWSVLDRIIASTGTTLYEVDTGTTSVLLYTLPDGDSWTDVVDADGAIAASASNGFVYVFALNDAAELTVTGQSRMKGEVPTALSARGGLVFVATADGDSARLWMAEGPGLDGLQLLREWETASIHSLVSSRDRLVVGVNEGGQAWTWRLEFATLGLSKALELGSGDVDGLAVIEGTTVAGVSTSGVWRSTETLQAEGWLIGPMSDFFRADEKSWVTGWADVEVESGQSVVLYFTTVREALDDPDHLSWRQLRTYLASAEGVEVGLGGVAARALAGMVRLSADTSANTSPAVRSMSFRSYPGPGDVVVQLPVDVGDHTERFGKVPVRVNGRGVATTLPALRDLESQAVTCQVFRTGEVVRGVVESVATPVPAFTPRGSPTQMSMVVVRGRRVSVTSQTSAGIGFGTGRWGQAVFGGGSAA